jgi:hypothetical protein
MLMFLRVVCCWSSQLVLVRDAHRGFGRSEKISARELSRRRLPGVSNWLHENEARISKSSTVEVEVDPRLNVVARLHGNARDLIYTIQNNHQLIC